MQYLYINSNDATMGTVSDATYSIRVPIYKKKSKFYWVFYRSKTPCITLNTTNKHINILQYQVILTQFHFHQVRITQQVSYSQTRRFLQQKGNLF